MIMKPDEDHILIGAEHQAVVPSGLCHYGDALPYDNEDTLLWDPGDLSQEQVENYLEKAGKMGVALTFFGNPQQISDDERALYYLVKSGYNSDEALRRLSQRNTNPLLVQPEPLSGLPFLSLEECLHFEAGLSTFGKDFRLIQMFNVHTRSIGELVHFYYHWKKSERFDTFKHLVRLVDSKRKKSYNAKNYKRKYKIPINPYVTDMSKLLDELKQVTNSTDKLSLFNEVDETQESFMDDEELK